MPGGALLYSPPISTPDSPRSSLHQAILCILSPSWQDQSICPSHEWRKLVSAVICSQLVVLKSNSFYPYSHTLSTPPAPCHCPRVAASRPLGCQCTPVVDPLLPTATLPPLTVKALARAPLREMYLCQPTRKKKRRKALYSNSLGEERVPKFSCSFTKYLFLLRKLSNS